MVAWCFFFNKGSLSTYSNLQTLGAGRHGGLTWDGLRRRIQNSWSHVVPSPRHERYYRHYLRGFYWRSRSPFLKGVGVTREKNNDGRKWSHSTGPVGIQMPKKRALGQLGDHELVSSSSPGRMSRPQRLFPQRALASGRGAEMTYGLVAQLFYPESCQNITAW